MPESKYQKTRLDVLMVERGLTESREKARALILEGKVSLNGSTELKPGMSVQRDVPVEILRDHRYVSRGGLKLEAALTSLNVGVEGKAAMDVGASTGGFTDCLLQHGARKVYAVDVGYGQFSWKLRNHPRVALLERTNVRYLDRDAIKEPVDIAVIDVSFISLLKVIPKVAEFVAPSGEILALIKPQFEAARKDVGKGGVVKDERKHAEIIEKISLHVAKMGCAVKGTVRSPAKGPKGNVEYFIYMTVKVDLRS